NVAEAVMKSCEKDELLFHSAWRKQHGVKVEPLVANLRENFRMSAALKILELRLGNPLGSPIATWNACVGAHSIEKGAAEPAEAAAERALGSCLVQEDAMVKEAEQFLGPAYGPAVRERFRSDART